MVDAYQELTKTNPRLILVCGPWSSGTTAVSGMLSILGLNGLGPFFQTNDERTKNSYESIAFRDMVMSVASEQTVSLTVEREAALAAVTAFRDRVVRGEFGEFSDDHPLFLKYPLSALLLREICQVFSTRLVYVLRPLREIEATRQRRNWSENLGAKGAGRIYSTMFDVLINHGVPTLVLRYPELLAKPEFYARQLAAFSGVHPDDPVVGAAAGFIRRPAQPDAVQAT